MESKQDTPKDIPLSELAKATIIYNILELEARNERDKLTAAEIQKQLDSDVLKKRIECNISAIRLDILERKKEVVNFREILKKGKVSPDRRIMRIQPLRPQM